MTSDLVQEDGPSIIQSDKQQLVKFGPHIIVGPFRFGNHCCKPLAAVRFFLKLCIQG